MIEKAQILSVLIQQVVILDQKIHILNMTIYLNNFESNGEMARMVLKDFPIKDNHITIHIHKSRKKEHQKK